MKQKYYRLDRILKTDCPYNILLGERSNGKSFAVKEFCIKDAYLNNNEFGYLRRWEVEATASKIEKYFEDVIKDDKGVEHIKKWTNGEYSTIAVYRGDIFLANEDEKGKKVRGKRIGSKMHLTGETHYKSMAFPSIVNIIFEEFITDSGYLPNEVSKFTSIISTALRRRNGRIFLIGNTLTPVCPYFSEWNLINVPNQKIGTIEIYKHITDQVDDDGKTIEITIAVEYCENSGNNTKVIIGKQSKMITKGTWQSEEVPHLLESWFHYDKLYSIYYEYQLFKFHLQLLKKDDDIFVYVMPFVGSIPTNKRVVTDKYSFSLLSTTNLENNILGKYDRIIVWLLKNGKIRFQDNLTGANFKQIRVDKGVW